MLLLLFDAWEGFLRFFIGDSDLDEWQDTAFPWFITAVVVAILVAGVVFAFKGYRKKVAGIAWKKIWTRRETWLLVVVGVFPVFIVLLIIWYLNHDFYNFVQVGGLLKGAVFSWLLYLVIMVLGHLVSPWRRELI
jgi:hypothetical protein